MSTSPKKKVYQPSRRVVDAVSPVQLVLAWVLIVLFPVEPDAPPTEASPTHIAAVLRLIAIEAFEVSQDRLTYDSLCRSLDRLYARERRLARKRNDKLRARGQPVPADLAAAGRATARMDEILSNFANVSDGCAFIGIIERELRNRISEGLDELPDTPEPLDRRSPLGLYFRQLLVALRRLSFADTSALAEAVARWCGLAPGPSVSASLAPAVHVPPPGLVVDSTVERREQAMAAYERARDSGDYSGALAAMRRFYDYQPPSPAQAQPQRAHALVSLASFLYTTGGLDEARSVIEEAIRNSRSQGESQCLQQCMSIYHRLNTETDVPVLSTDAPRVAQALETRLPKAAVVADDLWLLQAALDLGEPVHLAFRRIYTALARLDIMSADGKDSKDDKEKDKGQEKGVEHGADSDFDFGAWHAAQARLWDMLGSNTLAEHHWELAASEPGVELDTVIARAEKASECGDFESALGALVDWECVRGMSIEQYHSWAEALWILLERRATLAQDSEAMIVVARARPDAPTRAGPGAPARVQASKRQQTADAVAASLSTAEAMLDGDDDGASAPAHLILPHALLALELSASLSLWQVYRRAAVALAACFVLVDSPDGAAKAREVVAPVVERLTDESTRARAQLVLAQCAIARALDAADGAGGAPAGGALDEAARHLDAAETHARAAGAARLVVRALQLRALLADARGEDGAADVVAAWDAARASAGGQGVGGGDEARRLAALVARVGTRVAQGWA